MVVREKVGRKRYIAFEVVSGSGDLTRSKLVRKIEKLDLRIKCEVILLEGGMGIVRSDHRSVDAMSDALRSFSQASDGFELKTRQISGTIRTLKERYFRSEHRDGARTEH